MAGSQTSHMAVKFTPEEHRQSAMACRAAAHIAEQDAKKQQNPTTALGFQTTAIGYRQLAAKHEAAALQK